MTVTPPDPSLLASGGTLGPIPTMGMTNPFGPSFDPNAKFVTTFMRDQTAFLRQQTANSLSGKGAGSAYVFTGGRYGHVNKIGSASPNNPGVTLFDYEQEGKKYRSLMDMMREFDSWDFEKKQHMGKLLMMAGYGDKPNSGQSFEEALKTWTLSEFEGAYGELLSEASSRFAAGQNVTPEQLLENRIKFNLTNAGLKVDGDFNAENQAAWWKQLNVGADGELGPGDPGFNGKVTTTQRHVDIYSPEDTKGLVRGVLQQELGRDPTQAELEDFSAALTHAMRANPDRTSETSVYKDGRVVSSNSTTQQGIGAAGLQAVAEDKARSQPGWAEFQAAGVYLPDLFSVLGSAVPGT